MLTKGLVRGKAGRVGTLLLVLGRLLLPSRCRWMMRAMESRKAPARLATFTD